MVAEFLSSQWVATVNDILGEVPRGVITPFGDARMIVQVTSESDVIMHRILFRTHQGCPSMSVLDHDLTDVQARVTLSSHLLQRMFLQADVPGMLAGWRNGEVIVSGQREILLFYLYHLLPGGYTNATGIAHRIKDMTTGDLT